MGLKAEGRHFVSGNSLFLYFWGSSEAAMGGGGAQRPVWRAYGPKKTGARSARARSARARTRGQNPLVLYINTYVVVVYCILYNIRRVKVGWDLVKSSDGQCIYVELHEDLLHQRKHTGSWDEDKAYSTPGKHYPTFLEFNKLCPRPNSMCMHSLKQYIDPQWEYSIRFQS